MKKKTKKRKTKINWFNVFVLVMMIPAIFTLGHDFIKWAILPLFNHEFYQLTYFGFFVDMASFFIIEASIQYFKSEMEK